MVSLAGNPLAAAFVAGALTVAGIQVDGLRDAALSWHIPPPVPVMRGLRLCMDAGRAAPMAIKVAREAMRANPRLDAVDALLLGTQVVEAAHARSLPPPFLAAALLQESAFNPAAISAAGAVGIAQFAVPVAAEYDVDPWNPRSAIGGAARVLAAYRDTYRERAGADPYALALAAYNAGPAAVTAYGGVPPYAETREYIADVRERWSRIVGR